MPEKINLCIKNQNNSLVKYTNNYNYTSKPNKHLQNYKKHNYNATNTFI